MSDAAIAIDAVSFAYPGSRAGVFDIDLTIGAGELVAVIGASGCGKSTLLKLIAGFLMPDRGRIAIGGTDMTDVPPRARNLARLTPVHRYDSLKLNAGQAERRINTCVGTSTGRLRPGRHS